MCVCVFLSLFFFHVDSLQFYCISSSAEIDTRCKKYMRNEMIINYCETPGYSAAAEFCGDFHYEISSVSFRNFLIPLRFRAFSLTPRKSAEQFRELAVFFRSALSSAIPRSDSISRTIAKPGSHLAIDQSIDRELLRFFLKRRDNT